MNQMILFLSKMIKINLKENIKNVVYSASWGKFKRIIINSEKVIAWITMPLVVGQPISFDKSPPNTLFVSLYTSVEDTAKNNNAPNITYLARSKSLFD